MSFQLVLIWQHCGIQRNNRKSMVIENVLFTKNQFDRNSRKYNLKVVPLETLAPYTNGAAYLDQRIVKKLKSRFI